MSLLMSTALVSMEGRVQIKSTAIPVPAAQASLAPTANTRSMSVTPSPASTEASVKMPWSPSVAPALRATLATAARYTHSQTLLKGLVKALSLHSFMFID